MSAALAELSQLTAQYLHARHDGVRINGVKAHAEEIIRRRIAKEMSCSRLNNTPAWAARQVNCWVLICAGVRSQKALACSLPGSG